MRRNGAENIGINQQPVQQLTALQRPHKTAACHPSPAQPSPAQPFRVARLFVEPPRCCFLLRYALQDRKVYRAPRPNLLVKGREMFGASDTAQTTVEFNVWAVLNGTAGDPSFSAPIIAEFTNVGTVDIEQDARIWRVAM